MSTTSASYKLIKLQITLPNEVAAELTSVTSITPKIDYNKVDWQEFANNGWTSSKITGKTMSVSVEAKAALDDELYKKMLAIALGGGADDHNDIGFEIVFEKQDPASVTAGALQFNGTLEITDLISSAAEDVVPFNFDITVTGIPVYVEEA